MLFSTFIHSSSLSRTEISKLRKVPVNFRLWTGVRFTLCHRIFTSTMNYIENVSTSPENSKSNLKRKMSEIDNKPVPEYDDGSVHVDRQRTTVEKELYTHKVQAHEVVTHLPQQELPTVQAYIPQALSGALFCGHLVTDLDSIAGAIGAAELYGGIPGRASEINSETAFALQYWGVEKPRPIEELLVELPKAGVCLVDHQQTSQLNKSIDVSENFHLFSVSRNK